MLQPIAKAEMFGPIASGGVNQVRVELLAESGTNVAQPVGAREGDRHAIHAQARRVVGSPDCNSRLNRQIGNGLFPP